MSIGVSYRVVQQYERKSAADGEKGVALVEYFSYLVPTSTLKINIKSPTPTITTGYQQNPSRRLAAEPV